MGRLKPEELEYVRELGHGSFGTVQVMKSTVTNRNYAVKIEPCNTRAPQLQYESRVYMELKGVEHVVKAYLFWRENGRNYLALELLGPSLEAARAELSVTDIITWVAPQAIAALRNIHNKDYLHRDIKPDNFLLGTGGVASRQIYLIDFGLSKKYRLKGEHISYKNKKHLTGTARYASIHTHLGSEQGRRDDMESLGYMLVYLMRGSLPWQQGRSRTSQKHRTKAEQYQAISECKLTTTIDSLCDGLPVAMTYYFKSIKSLQFEDAPDYDTLINFFRSP